jgi:hypothetical protein
VASGDEEKWKILCDEVDEQNKNYCEEKYPFGVELAGATLQAKTSFYCEYVIFIPRQRKAILSDGLTCRRGFKIPYGVSKKV